MGVLYWHYYFSKVKVENSLKVLSANCQGLRNCEKRNDVLTYFKEMGANIICLQDTHLTQRDIFEIKKLWKGDIFLSGDRTNSRGVAILLNHNFEYTVFINQN